jgi:hypothetical protein
VRRYLYKIFYNAIGDVIEILHVRHRSRRPWMARKDDPGDEP